MIKKVITMAERQNIARPSRVFGRCDDLVSNVFLSPDLLLYLFSLDSFECGTSYH